MAINKNKEYNESIEFQTLYTDLLDGLRDYLANKDSSDPATHIHNSLGNGDINEENLNQSLLDTYGVNSPDYWHYIITMMNKELTNDQIGERIGVRLGDFLINGESVIDYIEDKIDVTKKLFDQPEEKAHWNQSVQELKNQYLQILESENNKRYTDNILFSHLKRADAGYRYNESEKDSLVVPTNNQANQLYYEVRDIDLLPDAVYQSYNSQYTCESHDFTNWIYTRLIMPQYDRRVEVEDLDRNFWVIAQVIAGITDYLFDDPFPFKDLLEPLLNELPQLWENVAYLWAELAILSQKEFITDVKTFFIPVCNDGIDTTLEHYVKFDNFEQWSGSTEKLLEIAIHNLEYLTYQYSESNLFIVPEFRWKNYHHNWYSGAIYPGAIFYNRNTNKWIKLHLGDTDFNNVPCSIDLTSSEDTIAQLMTPLNKSNHQYHYADNYQTIPADIIGFFYRLARSESIIDINFTKDGLSINKLEIQFYDVGYEKVRQSNSSSSKVGSIIFNYINTMEPIIEDTILTVTKTPNQEHNRNYKTGDILITSGFYQGELISGYPHLSINGNFEIEVFAYNQIGDNYTEITWTDYVNTNSTLRINLESKWQTRLQSHLSATGRGNAKFVLRRVVMRGTEESPGAFEVCDKLATVIRYVDGTTDVNEYPIVVENYPTTSNHEYGQKYWPDDFTLPMVSSDPSGNIGRHSTQYLGGLKKGNKEERSTNATSSYYYQSYPFTNWPVSGDFNDTNFVVSESSGVDKWLYLGSLIFTPERNQRVSRKELTYAEKLRLDNSISETRIVDEVEVSVKSWYENPPSTHENQVTLYSKVGTFITSPASVTTSGNKNWELGEFYLVVIDRTYLYLKEGNNTGNKTNIPDQVVAYYYKCTLESNQVVAKFYTGAKKKSNLTLWLVDGTGDLYNAPIAYNHIKNVVEK